MEALIDKWGEPALLAAAGAFVGLIFGACAQRSAFCLRAATIELAERRVGDRMAVWLLAFGAALTAVQGAQAAGLMDLSTARALAATGSMSGAIIGGLMFGIGMILARGCASRLLVLSATGNLRALLTGLILTLVAQAAYTGVLSPLRTAIAQLWIIEGGAARVLPVAHGAAAMIGAALVFAAWRLGARTGYGRAARLSAIGVGLAVALGWCASHAIAQASFEIVPVSSITFTGPAMDTLMVLVVQRDFALNFGIGLVPGVAAGSCVSALVAGTWRIQRFGPDTPMERYLIGAVLMGFGAMLAGGCAVGAGLSGGSVLSMTAWVAVFCMWVGAVGTHRAMRARPKARRAAQDQAV